MNIVFDEYPHYIGAISKIFKNYINVHIKCDHGHSYYSIKDDLLTRVNEESWGEIKGCFPGAKQAKKCPTTSLYKIFTYVQNERNQIGEIFDCPPNNEHTFSVSYFIEEPILYVSTIEESMRLINLYRVPKEGDEVSPQRY